MTVPTGVLHGLLDDAAARHPDTVALRTADTSWTYARLDRHSRAAAAGLGARGITRGDRVVLFAHNSAALVSALFALSRLGAAFVIVSPTVKPYHLRHILADCAPALVLVDDELGTVVAGTGADVPVEPLTAIAEDGTCPQGAVGPDDVAALIYTSGSTSMPKAVISDHAAMRFATGAVQERLELRPGDVIGCFLPLAFDYGLYQVFLACASGATLSLGTMADAGPGLLRLLNEWEVTVLPAVPALAAVLLRLAARRPAGLPPLRMVTNTGAHFPESYAQELRRHFPAARLHPMFGLTECKRVSILLPGELAERPGSVGRPLSGTTCLIVDEHGRPVPPGTKGELVVRGPHVMRGYHNAPEQTARRFRTLDGERALFTGDLCSMDEDGFLYFHGREDDVYKSRGFRVSALEVEAAALDVDGVTAAAVVLSEERGALLAVRTARTTDEVRAGLRARLDDHKVPDHIHRVDALPLNTNGKVDKAALRRALETGR
ncbi:class I adenylate-forming enzyme family protein [Streptomyces sp. NPDC093510]|uniref:class I adenylate-forming enzyme family protein n=1 Tax=Streptomyces sp. NPDC093510 TaxID=3155199 RepID=UPI00343251AC